MTRSLPILDLTSHSKTGLKSQMHYRMIAADEKVSAMALGCMGMSDMYGPRDDAESTATIHAALDAGLNFVDTADMYGPHTNEVLVGNAIRQRRSDVFLATKFGIVRDPNDPQKRGIDGRPEYVKSCCDASLKRLGVDVIDLYYQHRIDVKVPVEETVGAMTDLVGEGKVRFLGLSEASTETIRRAHAVHPISAVQTEYSIWSRDADDDGIISCCRELGILFIAYSPLGRGFLTGTIKSFDDFAPDDFRRNAPRFQGENFQKNLEIVERLKLMALERNVTTAQLALAWVMAQGDHIIPVFGTKKPRYVGENLKALDLKMTSEDLLAIEAIAPQSAFCGTRFPEAMMKLVNV